MASVKLQPITYYQIPKLKNLKREELAEMYNNYRRVVNKRLDVMKRSNLKWVKGSKTFKYNYDRYKFGAHAYNKSELAHAIYDMQRFLRSHNSSLNKMKKNRSEAIKKLQDNGYDFIDAYNFEEFMKMFEDLKSTKVGELKYELIRDVWDNLKKMGVSKSEFRKDFYEYMDYHDEIVALKSSGQKVSSNDILKTLRSMNWHGIY